MITEPPCAERCHITGNQLVHNFEKRQELWNQLSILTQLCINEDKVSRDMFAIFSAANAVLVTALLGGFRVLQTDTLGRGLTLLVAAVTGALISWPWAVIQRRIHRHHARFESLSDQVEIALGLPPCFSTTARNEESYRRVGLRPTGEMKWLMELTPRIAMVLWSIASIAIAVLVWPLPLLHLRGGLQLSTSEGLSWSAVIFAFLGAALSAYSSASVSSKFVAMLGTWGGGGKVPIKILLDQKAYTSGALIAMGCAFAAQVGGLAEVRGGPGDAIVALAVLAALVVLAYTARRRKVLVSAYQRSEAGRVDATGKPVDALSAETDNAEYVEYLLGTFYDCPRRRNEAPDVYRSRLSKRVQRLAQS